MRGSPNLRSIVLGTCCAVALGAAACAGPAAGQDVFVAEPIAEGIFLYRPSTPGSDRANSLVVDHRDGLLVVDAQPTPAAASELLAALDSQFAKPVRFLVLSHSHAEAAGGASAFPESVVVISSADCAAAMSDPDYDFGAEQRGRSPAPEQWEAPPRVSPSLGVRATIDIEDPRQPAQIRVHPRAHSVGDLTVFFPEASVLYLGGLLSHDRNPYAGDANVGRWLGMLNSVIVDAPRTIVGLHGPVSDLGKLIEQRDSFAWLRGRVEEGFIDRVPPEKIAGQVMADPDTADRFATGAEPSFVGQLVDQVLEESVIHRRKRGLLP